MYFEEIEFEVDSVEKEPPSKAKWEMRRQGDGVDVKIGANHNNNPLSPFLCSTNRIYAKRLKSKTKTE